jgi:hypothetical protein
MKFETWADFASIIIEADTAEEARRRCLNIIRENLSLRDIQVEKMED